MQQVHQYTPNIRVGDERGREGFWGGKQKKRKRRPQLVTTDPRSKTVWDRLAKRKYVNLTLGRKVRSKRSFQPQLPKYISVAFGLAVLEDNLVDLHGPLRKKEGIDLHVMQGRRSIGSESADCRLAAVTAGCE